MSLRKRKLRVIDDDDEEETEKNSPPEVLPLACARMHRGVWCLQRRCTHAECSHAWMFIQRRCTFMQSVGTPGCSCTNGTIMSQAKWETQMSLQKRKGRVLSNDDEEEVG